jgi:hypothetical protein
MKLDTTTILLIAVGIGAIYFITRPAVPATIPYNYQPVYNPYAANVNQGNATAQDISAGGTAASQVADALSNLF